MTSGDKKDDEVFSVTSGRELREAYELTAANRPEVRLSQDRVPEALWALIGDAELVGISDDLIRDAVWAQLPLARRDEISARVKAVAAELDAWLGGPRPCRPIRPTNTWRSRRFVSSLTEVLSKNPVDCRTVALLREVL